MFEHQLNPVLTFEEYVVGSSNLFPFSAARAVAEHRNPLCNPLLLCGDSGLGKTHLLHAIGNAVLSAKPGTHVLLICGELFAKEVGHVFQYDKIKAFREGYRRVDILLVDDVNQIAGHDLAQEELYCILCDLVDESKQVVMTSKMFPHRQVGLKEFLRAYLASTLIANFQPADFETRKAVLFIETEQNGVTLPKDVIDFLLNSDMSISQLGHCVSWLSSYTKLTDMPISLRIAEQYRANFSD